jgi:hypothetical protein
MTINREKALPLVSFEDNTAFVIFNRSSKSIRDPMNALIEDFRQGGGTTQESNRNLPSHRPSKLCSLKAAVRPIDCRRDDLERMHWKKVWRSMFED